MKKMEIIKSEAVVLLKALSVYSNDLKDSMNRAKKTGSIVQLIRRFQNVEALIVDLKEFVDAPEKQ